MKVLGIETSCDETAAAVVELKPDGQLTLHSSVIASSMDLHAVYGGVVPEIAARSHIEHMTPVIEKALENETWDEIDAIAVTQGPGLGGSLLVGVTTARTLAVIKNKPLYAVNHVMAHPFAALITAAPDGFAVPKTQPSFPILSLIVSGGHSQLVLFSSPFEYQVLGRTRDDAIGEAFDKVAKILGLPYPGGPSIEKKAADGNPNSFMFPDARLDSVYDFSFSGLKTAVLRAAQSEIGQDHAFPSMQLSERLTEAQKADLAASFQDRALMTVADKTFRAYEQYKPQSIVAAGGVAASSRLRKILAEKLPVEAIYPDIKLCTDNGAMIASVGCYMHQAGAQPADPYTLDISPSLAM